VTIFTGNLSGLAMTAYPLNLIYLIPFMYWLYSSMEKYDGELTGNVVGKKAAHPRMKENELLGQSPI
jgi:hypothetical protein